MHVLVTCKYKKDRTKNNQEKMDIVFPIISQLELSVAMETRNIQVLKCGRQQMTTDDEQMTDHWYTISSPCEPSAHVS